MFGSEKITISTIDDIKRITENNRLTKKQQDEEELDRFITDIKNGSLHYDAKYFVNYIGRSSHDRIHSIKKAIKESKLLLRLDFSQKTSCFGFGNEKTFINIIDDRLYFSLCFDNLINRSHCANFRFKYELIAPIKDLETYILSTSIQKIFSQIPGCKIVERQNNRHHNR